jgi:hypothetical protein
MYHDARKTAFDSIAVVGCRKIKYAHELHAVIDRALECIDFHGALWGSYSGNRHLRTHAQS